MAKWLLFLGKSVVIAICAAIATVGYLIVVGLTLEVLGQPRGEVSYIWIWWLLGALVGTFSIGLPIAWLVYFLSWRQLIETPVTLAMITTLAGIMMMLTSYFIGGAETMYLTGMPAAIAAAVFGVLGWFWIVRPVGKEANA